MRIEQRFPDRESVMVDRPKRTVNRVLILLALAALLGGLLLLQAEHLFFFTSLL